MYGWWVLEACCLVSTGGQGEKGGQKEVKPKGKFKRWGIIARVFFWTLLRGKILEEHKTES